MKKFDQLYRCHQCLDSRRTPISKRELAEALECTPRSVERYIEDLQTYWEAPINYRPRRGYQYDPEQREKWQVPGLWMTREESQKLLLLLNTQLDNHFKFSYGIFAGEPDQQAVLRFLPPVATEIARQQWHPRQSGRWEKKHYILSIPYSNPTELKQDILKHLPNVVVEAPAVLQKEIRTTLLESLTRHQNTV